MLKGDPATWLLDLTDGELPSPALLAQAPKAGRCEYCRISPRTLTAPESQLAVLPDAAEVVEAILCAEGPSRPAAESLLLHLRAAGVRSRLIDPSVATIPPLPGRDVPAYELAPSRVHAEIGAGPAGAPLHPWLRPAPAGVPWRERLAAAARALTGPEPALYLDDPSLPLDLTRLRAAAEVVRQSLRERDVLIHLHLRAWPADLLADAAVVEHLPLLPLASLELLLGGFGAAAGERDGRAAGGSAALERARSVGLAHLCTLSMVIGHPEESADDCAESIKAAVNTALRAGVPRLRLGLCLDGPQAPASSEEQDRRFLASHPDWHPLEYRGLFDLVALLQAAVPAVTILGPGHIPGWEPAEIELPAAETEA
jgi:hypothetical protein